MNFLSQMLPKWISIYFDIWILLTLLERQYGFNGRKMGWVKYIASLSIIVFAYDAKFQFFTSPDLIFYLIVVLSVAGSFSLLLKGNLSSKVLTTSLAACMLYETNMLSFAFLYIYPEHTFRSLWPWLFLTKTLQVLMAKGMHRFPIQSKFNIPKSYQVIMYCGVTLTILSKWMINQVRFMPLHPVLFGLYIFTYLIFFRLVQNYDKRLDLQLRNKQLTLQLEGWSDMEAAYLELKKLRHDMQSHVAYMQSLLAVGDYERLSQYLCQVDDKQTRSKKIVHTGIPVIDSVLSAKSAQCSVLDIPIHIKATLPHSLWVDDYDICSLLSNLIDNAAEASKQMADPDLQVDIYERKGLLIISVSNRLHENVLETNPELLTTKKDTGEHGLGTGIVRDIVKHYNGVVLYTYSKGYLTAKVCMPKPIQVDLSQLNYAGVSK